MREKGKRQKIRAKEGNQRKRAGKKSKTQAGFNLEASHRRWSDLYLNRGHAIFSVYLRLRGDAEDPCLDVHIQRKKQRVPIAHRTP